MKLYRYRSMAATNLGRMFTHCEVYFASPTQFNDPFDCNPPFSITDYSKDDLREHIERALRSRCEGMRASQLKAIVKKNVSRILKNKSFESDIAKPFVKVCPEVNSGLGVLCLSEVPDDILMWSHYANGHQGIVLQFDKSGLLSERDFEYCKKVDYKNNILTLKDINRNDPDELARLVLLKKTKRWGYEREWRIIVDPSRRRDVLNCRIFTFSKEALTGVIFGCKMTPTTPTGRLMVHLLSAFAEFEREVIKERVKAGIVHVKVKGVKIGRPSLTIDRDELRQLRDSGLTIRAIADKTNLKRSFVHKTLLDYPSATPMESRGGVPTNWTHLQKQRADSCLLAQTSI